MTDQDYVIVGSGSAGCAVAHELARTGKSVLVLEAGGSDSAMLLKLPMGVALADTRRFDWSFQSVPDPTRGGKSESWTRGRVVGGTSSINGMNYVRGAPADFDHWEALGNAGWSARDVAPIFRELERCDPATIPPGDQSRGYVGALDVRMVRDRHPVIEQFVSAATAAGHRFTQDYNGAEQEGIGYVQLNQRGRLRCSAADALLRPALACPNVKLISNAQVHYVIIDEGRARGVRFSHNGTEKDVTAGTVILSAGAICTPHLLLLSGVGDPIQLDRHKIKLKVSAPGVGQNLMEHPMITCLYRMKGATYNSGHPFLRAIRIGWQYLAAGQGPLSCAFEAMAFLKTSAMQERPDIQLHVAAFGFAAMPTTKAGERPRLQMLPFPSMTILLNKNYPLSRGRVSLQDADPRTAPLIEPNLLGAEEDVQTLVSGIETVRGIFGQSPLSEIVEDEMLPGPSRTEDLSAYVRANAHLGYHASGTCRMGADAGSVVDPQLRVRGLEGLYIADASIMPTLISGNTNAACMMIGSKLGKQLRTVNQ